LECVSYFGSKKNLVMSKKKIESQIGLTTYFLSLVYTSMNATYASILKQVGRDYSKATLEQRRAMATILYHEQPTTTRPDRKASSLANARDVLARINPNSAVGGSWNGRSTRNQRATRH